MVTATEAITAWFFALNNVHIRSELLRLRNQRTPDNRHTSPKSKYHRCEKIVCAHFRMKTKNRINGIESGGVSVKFRSSAAQRIIPFPFAHVGLHFKSRMQPMPVQTSNRNTYFSSFMHSDTAFRLIKIVLGKKRRTD